MNLIGAGTGAKLEGWETLSVPEKTSKIISRLSFLEANKDDVKKFSRIYNDKTFKMNTLYPLILFSFNIFLLHKIS